MESWVGGFQTEGSSSSSTGSDGTDDVIIKGNYAKDAFKQLKSATNLNLKMDSNGKVTASGKAKTDADKKLLEATTDSSVIVELNTTNSNYHNNGNWIVAGTFDGSTINQDGTVTANQTANTTQSKEVDEFYGSDIGVTVLHEVLEAFIGGKESPGTGPPTFNDVQNKTANGLGYLNAHNKAKQLDPRYIEPNVTHDCNTCPKYINKPHPVIPGLNIEVMINNMKP